MIFLFQLIYFNDITWTFLDKNCDLRFLNVSQITLFIVTIYFKVMPYLSYDVFYLRKP